MHVFEVLCLYTLVKIGQNCILVRLNSADLQENSQLFHKKTHSRT